MIATASAWNALAAELSSATTASHSNAQVTQLMSTLRGISAC